MDEVRDCIESLRHGPAFALPTHRFTLSLRLIIQCRYRVFGANAFHDQDDGEGEVETPLLSFVFNADGIAISVSIDTAGPHPDLGGALQQGGDDDLDTSLSDDSDFGPDQA